MGIFRKSIIRYREESFRETRGRLIFLSETRSKSCPPYLAHFSNPPVGPQKNCTPSRTWRILQARWCQKTPLACKKGYLRALQLDFLFVHGKLHFVAGKLQLIQQIARNLYTTGTIYDCIFFLGFPNLLPVHGRGFR